MKKCANLIVKLLAASPLFFQKIVRRGIFCGIFFPLSIMFTFLLPIFLYFSLLSGVSYASEFGSNLNELNSVSFEQVSVFSYESSFSSEEEDFVLNEQEEDFSLNEEEEEEEDFVQWENVDLNYFTLSIDSEFVVSPSPDPISIQFILNKEDLEYEFVVINQKYEDDIFLELEKFRLKYPDVYIGFDSFDSGESPLIKHMLIFFKSKHMLVNLKEKILLDTYFYYSPKDLEYSFGSDVMLPYYQGKRKPFSQKRNPCLDARH